MLIICKWSLAMKKFSEKDMCKMFDFSKLPKAETKGFTITEVINGDISIRYRDRNEKKYVEVVRLKKIALKNKNYRKDIDQSTHNFIETKLIERYNELTAHYEIIPTSLTFRVGFLKTLTEDERRNIVRLAYIVCDYANQRIDEIKSSITLELKKQENSENMVNDLDLSARDLFNKVNTTYNQLIGSPSYMDAKTSKNKDQGRGRPKRTCL